MNRSRFGQAKMPDPAKVTRIEKLDISDPKLLREFIPVSIDNISVQDILPFSVYFPFMQPNASVEFIKIAPSGGFLNSRWKTIFRENI
jgi:hypothetical protein